MQNEAVLPVPVVDFALWIGQTGQIMEAMTADFGALKEEDQGHTRLITREGGPDPLQGLDLDQEVPLLVTDGTTVAAIQGAVGAM